MMLIFLLTPISAFASQPIDGTELNKTSKYITFESFIDIKLCEEIFPQYETLGLHWFLENYHYSFQARICASLYEDPLWQYEGPDREKKLFERAEHYSKLEIAESAAFAFDSAADLEEFSPAQFLLEISVIAEKPPTVLLSEFASESESFMSLESICGEFINNYEKNQNLPEEERHQYLDWFSECVEAEKEKELTDKKIGTLEKSVTKLTEDLRIERDENKKIVDEARFWQIFGIVSTLGLGLFSIIQSLRLKKVKQIS